MFSETSFKQQQRKSQEHITPIVLRKFIADRCPVKNIKTIFDSSVGSGQLLQFLKFEHLTGVDINGESLKCCKTNFPNSDLINNSFFSKSSLISSAIVLPNGFENESFSAYNALRTSIE